MGALMRLVAAVAIAAQGAAAVTTARSKAAQFLSRAALQEGASKPRRTAGPSSGDSMSPATAGRTLLTLDMNHDGVVDPKEVAQFAESQGLDAVSVTQEFMDIDLNGDGRLDANEIAAALGDSSKSIDFQENKGAEDEEQTAVAQEMRRKAIVKGRRKLAEEAENRERKKKADAEAVLKAEKKEARHQKRTKKKAKERKNAEREERALARQQEEEELEEQEQSLARQREERERAKEKKLKKESGSSKKKKTERKEGHSVRLLEEARTLKSQAEEAEVSVLETEKPQEKHDFRQKKAAQTRDWLEKWSIQRATEAAHVDVHQAIQEREIAGDKEELAEEDGEEAVSGEGSVSSLLAKEAAWETEAQLLEQRAQELRLNATLLAKSTARLAVEAGARAARERSKSLLHSLNKLENGAKKAEVTAAALRAKADAEVQEANDLMNAADTALR